MQLIITLVIGGGAIFFATFIVLVFVAKFYRKIEQGKALIVNKMKPEPEVTFTGATVLPVFHKAEVMDISVKTIEIDRRGKEGLICRDNIRADIKVTFFVRVNKTVEDVIKVAQSIGCARASDKNTLEELFSAKFSEALKTVGKQLDFVDLYTKRNEFRDKIIELIGRDLNGYVLEDAAIDYLEQTPMSSLDPMNILDAQGIRRITELTAVEHIKTNEFENLEKKQVTKQNVETAETVLELERQQADAEARQKREIASIQAREQALAHQIQSEEAAKSSLAKIKADEEVMIASENKARQIEVAQKNRARVIGVETERVEKDRELEAIVREREVELNRIAKDKALEIERKEIADVVRARIAVEKGVAEEEERIKD
ncbi:MAG TPA: SPFH domain-containing protein, partial [Thermoanaerobaculia bacterium]